MGEVPVRAEGVYNRPMPKFITSNTLFYSDNLPI